MQKKITFFQLIFSGEALAQKGSIKDLSCKNFTFFQGFSVKKDRKFFGSARILLISNKILNFT
nr:MAG TPA: hypothetical protein [Caudoviricetes sp.]